MYGLGEFDHDSKDTKQYYKEKLAYGCLNCGHIPQLIGYGNILNNRDCYLNCGGKYVEMVINNEVDEEFIWCQNKRGFLNTEELIKFIRRTMKAEVK